ncbi:MAG TPA: glycosyltransferase [Anaeromyxobacteraceae bacterium]|jgi:cellulose synthase (UDP-forming)|nr:glycosyltransferase [Anaeromyxobacteraceae bacterium]
MIPTAPETRERWYFSRYEDRLPAEPLRVSPARDFAFQALAVLATALGVHYLVWRWGWSLNPDALAFSVAVAVAETLAFLGATLFFLSVWRIQDPVVRPPPRTANEIRETPLPIDRPIRVDVLIATFNEPVELVRLSVQDAKRLGYPHPLTLRIHVLDDGRRPAMARMAREEGVGYLTRSGNQGFKAGNLRNGLEQTDGDLVVICDADTRPLPGLLADTLGHFRDPSVAWVQTPQWFYDVDPGTPLPEWLARAARLGRPGRLIGRMLEAVIGPVAVGADPLAADPAAFYEIVQRGRNWCNASFCCGAGSIHRREAVMEAALKDFGRRVTESVRPWTAKVRDPELREALRTALVAQAARHAELTPYRFHVSEDIYTSIALHADPERRWRSVYHPRALTRMLSPQDLPAWTVQRFKYAAGTLDIGWRDNPLRLPGLTPWQKLMYGATIYAYLAPLWTIPLLFSPLAYFFIGVTPVRAFDAAFFGNLIPFLLASRLAFAVRAWGVPTWRAEQFHLASCWLNLRALGHVLAGRPLRFEVTPKSGARRRSLSLVAPHLAFMAAAVVGIAYRGARLAADSGPPHATAFASNVFWAAHTSLCFLPFILAALAVSLRREGGGAR